MGLAYQANMPLGLFFATSLVLVGPQQHRIIINEKGDLGEGCGLYAVEMPSGQQGDVDYRAPPASSHRCAQGWQGHSRPSAEPC